MPAYTSWWGFSKVTTGFLNFLECKICVLGFVNHQSCHFLFPLQNKANDWRKVTSSLCSRSSFKSPMQPITVPSQIYKLVSVALALRSKYIDYLRERHVQYVQGIRILTDKCGLLLRCRFLMKRTVTLRWQALNLSKRGWFRKKSLSSLFEQEGMILKFFILHGL